VLWTRFAALENYIPNAGAVSNLGSDPSAQYALDNENPPTDNQWWKPLPGAGNQVAKKDPYNNYSDLSILPPGPIANPSNAIILAAAAPIQSKYFYFLADHCGNIHYAQTNTQFNVIVQEYITQNKCSTSTN
jgi:cell division protein YceG involved in septum cleavage